LWPEISRFTPKAALGALPNVELKKYGFKFSFEAVSGEA
jgi:hypothetical protein